VDDTKTHNKLIEKKTRLYCSVPSDLLTQKSSIKFGDLARPPDRQIGGFCINILI